MNGGGNYNRPKVECCLSGVRDSLLFPSAERFKKKIWLYAGTSVYLSVLTLSVTIVSVQTISREDPIRGTLRDYMPDSLKREDIVRTLWRHRDYAGNRHST